MSGENFLYSGIDFELPGNGGKDCLEFLSLNRRLVETLLTLAVCSVCLYWSCRKISRPVTATVIRKDRGGKRILLVLLSLLWGIEIGFKFATRSFIFLLNPCHVTTALQIYLLAAPPSRKVTWIFRIHLNFLNGAILAILFPVTNTRLLPFETEIYWIQHIAMLVVPYYLLRLGGVYTIEKLSDMSWSCLSYAVLLSYHFLVLQPIGLVTMVNLNNMLCPAISDPFYGPNYRIAAILHQGLLVPLTSKGYCVIASFFLTKFPLTKVKDELETDVTYSAFNSAREEVRPQVVDKPLPTQRHRRSQSEMNGTK